VCVCVCVCVREREREREREAHKRGEGLNSETGSNAVWDRFKNYTCLPSCVCLFPAGPTKKNRFLS
jgi:hypothetical protein